MPRMVPDLPLGGAVQEHGFTELRQQAESIQHEAVGVLKAFLDAYAEKSGSGHGPGGSDSGMPRRDEPEEPPAPRVTDIPLD